MKRTIKMAVLAGMIASGAAAQGLTRVSDEAAFNQMVAGKQLRLGLMGIALTVSPDGTISGTASGYDVTGTWSWQDGYFCREMSWGGTPIPYNCQLVEAGGGQIRFVSDQGSGDDATFNLR